MAFMETFQPQRSSLSDLISQARQIGGNDPKGAVQQMADSGMTCNLPNGKTITVAEMLKMADGKSATELLSALGL